MTLVEGSGVSDILVQERLCFGISDISYDSMCCHSRLGRKVPFYDVSNSLLCFHLTFIAPLQLLFLNTKKKKKKKNMLIILFICIITKQYTNNI